MATHAKVKLDALSSWVIGIDIGGVLTETMTDDDRKNPDATFREVDGAIAGTKDLVDKFGAENVYIDSSCKEKMQRLSMEWLEEVKFFDRTGMLRKNVYFVEKREDKKNIWKKFGITHMIDDRIDVVGNCVKEGVVPVWFTNMKITTEELKFKEVTITTKKKSRTSWELDSTSKSSKKAFRSAYQAIHPICPEFPQKGNEKVMMAESWKEVVKLLC